MKCDVRGPCKKSRATSPAPLPRSFANTVTDPLRNSTFPSAFRVESRLFKMLSVLARQSVCALRSSRTLFPATSLLAAACTRTISTPSELPPKQPAMSQIDISDTRSPNTWMYVRGIVKEASETTPEEAWARRESTVRILAPPQTTWSGTCTSISCYRSLITSF